MIDILAGSSQMTNAIPMQSKIFVISLHRCGTQSLHNLLTSLGLRGKHWPDTHDGVDIQAQIVGRETDLDFVTECIAPVIADFDAVSDVPICALYEPLARIYPSARFIALTRPAEAWIASIHRHIGTRDLDPFEKVQYWKYLDRKPNSLAEIDHRELSDLLTRHYDEIVKFFAGTDRLYLGDLTSEQAGPEICRFLGYEPRALPHWDYLMEGNQANQSG